MSHFNKSLLANTAIVNTEKDFNTDIYFGIGANLAITGVGFRPDLIFIKHLNNAGTEPNAMNTIGPANNFSSLSSQGNEGTNANVLASIDNDGFTVGSSANTGANNIDYSSWSWKAGSNNTSTVSPGDFWVDTVQYGSAAAAGLATGTYTPTAASVGTATGTNTTGVSIIYFTANGTAGATVNHGLGATPAWVLVKRRSGGLQGRYVWHQNLTNTTDGFLQFNQISGETTDATIWNSTSPDATNVTLGSTINGDYIMYAFATVSNYSAFGSYTGTGTSGNAVTGLGFKPDGLIIKNISNNGNWNLLDTKRDTQNPRTKVWQPNNNNVQVDLTDGIDFDADGFTVDETISDYNTGTDQYIYCAFTSGQYTVPTPYADIDAANYPGTGTNWPDSQGNVTTTLNNAPTYNAANGGYFSFNGTNQNALTDYTRLASQGSVFVYEMWIRATAGTGNRYFFGDFNAAGASVTTRGTMGIVTNQLYANLGDNTNFQPGFQGETLTNNIWYHCVLYVNHTIGRMRLFVNGEIGINQDVSAINNVNGNRPYYIGSGSPSSLYFPGDIALVRIYTQELTNNQIYQRWEDSKARFGY